MNVKIKEVTSITMANKKGFEVKFQCEKEEFKCLVLKNYNNQIELYQIFHQPKDDQEATTACNLCGDQRGIIGDCNYFKNDPYQQLRCQIMNHPEVRLLTTFL